MAELILEPRIAAIAARGRISEDDVLFLRRTVYGDGLSSRAEVENLFALDGACHDKADSWPVFLIEAVCDYAVWQEMPEGYLSEDNAAWLQSLIVRDGHIDRVTELELLIKLMETARSCPASFQSFTLAQMEKSVTAAGGALNSVDDEGHARISGEAVSSIRRVLHAMGGEGNVAITRPEAEMMFNLNDACSGAHNDRAWANLFVKSIASFMMAASGYQAASRDKALSQERFMDAPSGGLGGFFSRMAGASLSGGLGWLQADTMESAYAERNAALEAERHVAERVTQDEASWLASRIGKDGRFGEGERQLVDFIKAESPSLHPEFAVLLAKVA